MTAHFIENSFRSILIENEQFRRSPELYIFSCRFRRLLMPTGGKNVHFTLRLRPVLKPNLTWLQLIIYPNLAVYRHFLDNIKGYWLGLNNFLMKVFRISYPLYRLDTLFDADICCD